LKFLLDTHTFLWFLNGDTNLSATARALIEDPQNERLLSIASLWEMAIKISIGKLEQSSSFEDLINGPMRNNAIDLLPITPSHLDTLTTLPFHHRDPFDRLIITQSIVEQMPIIGRDSTFDIYPVERRWAE
jgi:PIN domain nuclease of toxin-antitoxin system